MKAITQFKRRLNDSVKAVNPKYYAQSRMKKFLQTFHEPEMRLLPYLCDRQKASIDIGAAEGVFTAHILRNSLRCISFEPRPKQAEELRFILSHTQSNAAIESVALSDTEGTCKLRMLVEDPGRSTIEDANSLEDEDGSDRIEITVPIRRLDDYRFDDIGFIKIDVEGHELSVIQGGLQTISRCRPSLLIEIENRHRENAIQDVSSLLAGLDYRCYFLVGGDLLPASAFVEDHHQNPRNIGGWKSGWRKDGIYINNFIFVHSEKEARVLEAMRNYLAAVKPGA